MAKVEFKDSALLRLHPLRIQPFGDGNYSVIRRGGRTEIATRAVGVEALERFQAGDSIGATRRWIAESHGTSPESIRLEPLLKSLMNAGLIAAVDGVEIESKRIGAREHLKFHYRFEMLPRIIRAARHLPISVARQLLRRILGQRLRGPCQEKVRRAGANFEQVFPGIRHHQRDAFEKEYFDHLVWNVVDLEVLRQRSFEQAERWLEDSVRVEGIEVFDWARQQGRGVLLSGFHFSSNRLLPVVLMRRGYSLLSMGAISVGWGSQATKDHLAAWRAAYPSYGTIDLVDNLDLNSINKLIGALRDGTTVLTMPDVYSLSTFEDTAVAERARFFHIVRSRFPRSTLPVRFFSHWIDVNPWGGWLAAMSHPVILPVSMKRSGGKLLCRFGEPLEPCRDGDSKTRMARINEELFLRLQSEVEVSPSQWFGWHNLDQLNPRRDLELRKESI